MGKKTGKKMLFVIISYIFPIIHKVGPHAAAYQYGTKFETNNTYTWVQTMRFFRRVTGLRKSTHKLHILPLLHIERK